MLMKDVQKLSWSRKLLVKRTAQMKILFLFVLVCAVFVSLAIPPTRAQQPCPDYDGDGVCESVDCNDTDPTNVQICITRPRIEPLYYIGGQFCFKQKMEKLVLRCPEGVNPDPLNPPNSCTEVSRVTLWEESTCFEGWGQDIGFKP